jgi:hypothetical protein
VDTHLGPSVPSLEGRPLGLEFRGSALVFKNADGHPEVVEADIAVVITVVYPNGRAPVETTLENTDTVREMRMDKSTINSLHRAVAEPLSVGTTGTRN